MTLGVATIAAAIGCGGPSKDSVKQSQADKDAAATYTNTKHRAETSDAAERVKRKDGKSAWQVEFEKAQQGGKR
jgi:hypothetical protein